MRAQVPSGTLCWEARGVGGRDRAAVLGGVPPRGFDLPPPSNTFSVIPVDLWKSRKKQLSQKPAERFGRDRVLPPNLAPHFHPLPSASLMPRERISFPVLIDHRPRSPAGLIITEQSVSIQSDHRIAGFTSAIRRAHLQVTPDDAPPSGRNSESNRRWPDRRGAHLLKTALKIH